MQINRINYEEYFILYIDNELSPQEKAEVEAFVAANTDLATELDMLKSAVLKPHREIAFEDKQALMRSSDADNRIHADNCQEYFILYADDEISDEIKAEVEQFVYTHPERQAELEAFEQLKLSPEKIVFPGKEKLYRSATAHKQVVVNWWRYAAAAIVIIMAGSLWMINQPADTNNQVAGLTHQKKMSTAPANLHMENVSPAVKKEMPPTEQPDQAYDRQTTNAEHTRQADVVRRASMAGKDRLHPVDGRAGAGMQKSEWRTNLQTIKEPEVSMPKPDMNILTDVHPEVKNNTGFAKAETAAQQANIIHAVNAGDNAVASVEENNESSVYLANIPVDNPSLKPLLRKASRFLNRVSAIKSGKKPIIALKNVEIAIQ